MTTGTIRPVEMHPGNSRMYSALIESLRAIVWEADAETFQFRFVSKHAEEVLGFPASEWVSDRDFWKHHTHPDDVEQAARFCFDCIAKGLDHDFEYRMIARDGRVVWIRDIVTVDRSVEGRTQLRGIMIDVTERREMEDTLQHARKMEALGRLAGGIAHDFNNLLTIISSYGELLANDAAAGSKHADDIAEIRRAAQRGAQLTQRLLAFSRKDMVQPERVQLDREVADVTAMLERVIGPDVHLQVTLGCGTAAVMIGPGQLQQIVTNLALNARDAMPSGGTLTVTTQSDNAHLTLRVADTGAGMSASVKAHLFEPFFTTKGPGKGTGLGLSTVFGVVHQANGTITVDSREGQGSVFEIRLPRADG